MPKSMCHTVWKNTIPQAMHVFLPKVLQEVLVCAAWLLWKQSRLSLLQQLEDKGRRTQMPLKQ